MSNTSQVTMYQNATKVAAGNIAGKDAPGGKKQEFTFIASTAGNTTFVTSKVRAANDIQGEINTTGVFSDLAVNGNGLFVVSDSVSGETSFSRRADFRQDQEGTWVNGANQALKGWKLDDRGNVPQGSSSLSSLETLNFASTKGKPVATSILSLALNLNADQEALSGKGVNLKLSVAGMNAAKKIDDIIFPEKISSASVDLGDTFTFKSSDGSQVRKVTFGGMVIGKAPVNSTLGKIYGANTVNSTFVFPTPAALGDLQSGHQLRISVAGEIYTFTAVSGSENAANKTFNTINGLAAAINKVSALKASIDPQGRLYIAPVKADASVTFSNGNGGGIKEALGLIDLAASSGGVIRFNSLGSLRDAVNFDHTTYSLKSTLDGKNLKINSLLATSTFDITPSSLGVHAINKATINPANTEAGRATCYITAPGHTLVAGDLVNISGLTNGNLPDGIYSVGTAGINGFTIGLINNGSVFPAVGAAPVLALGNATWQKAGGEVFANQTGAITTTAGGGGPQDITITLAAHGLVVDDVIYTQGGLYNDGTNDVVLSAGYYRVSASAANTFVIKAVNGVAGTVYPVATSVTFRKIGSAAAGLPLAATGTFNTKVFSTNALGTNTVNYFIGTNHTYNIGDTITFNGLDATTGLVIDGITINNNVPYKVTTVDPSGFITFQAITGTATAGAQNSAYGAGAGLTPATIRVNNSSQLMQYFSLDPNQLHFDKAYDAASADKNMSEAVNGTSYFSSTQTYSVPVKIFDSLGDEYVLMLSFAKLQSNEWAVELTAQKDSNGEYEVTNTTTSNGLIRSGTIKFDSDGKLQSTPGLDAPITVTRNNGSAANELTFDWANVLSDITSGSVTQNKNANNIDIIQNNGRGAGTLTKLEVASNGDVIGTFDSGETQKLYRIPIATFNNVNGLTAGSDGTFQISKDSGDLLLKPAGSGGAGKIISGALEMSNVDYIEELMKAKDYSIAMQTNMRVIALESDNAKTILAELRG